MVMSEGHQSMKTQHPEYYWKWLRQTMPIYVKPDATGQNPEQHVLPNPEPTGQPLAPMWSSEQLMRMIQANTRINPDGVKAVYVPPEPVYAPGVQPTNPAIIERLEAYGEVGSRPWYPVAYIPYVGWPNRQLQSGIQV